MGVAWGGLRTPGRAGSCHMRQCSAFGKADMKWGREEARDSETWSFTKQQRNDLLWACHYLKSFVCIISFNTQTIRSIFTITLIFFFPRELDNLPQVPEQQGGNWTWQVWLQILWSSKYYITLIIETHLKSFFVLIPLFPKPTPSVNYMKLK